MIEFGPHWYNSKTTCANTVNAVLDDDIESTTSKHGWSKVGFGTQHGSLCILCCKDCKYRWSTTRLCI